MATLVLAATATPARIVSCRQDCGRLSGGWVIHIDKATGKKDCELTETIFGCIAFSFCERMTQKAGLFES
jgi:hypothetical protein